MVSSNPRLTLVLGNKAYSSWSLRPWLVLKQTGVAFEEVVIPLDRPETRGALAAYAPSGKVPVLLYGDERVWDSLAICEWIAEQFPSANLWPSDPVAKAYARSVSAEMHSGFSALRRHLPMDLKRRVPDRFVPAEVEADIMRIAEIWRTMRRRFGDAGPFLFGGFTIADAMFAPVCTRFETYGVVLEEISAAYAAAVLAWPAMTEWRTAAETEPWEIQTI